MVRKARSIYLTGSATARVLDVTRQAVSDAVYRMAIHVDGKPGRWRFPLEEVVWYAARTRQPMDKIIAGIQREISVDWLWAATFVLQVLGLESVVERLDPKPRPEGAE